MALISLIKKCANFPDTSGNIHPLQTLQTMVAGNSVPSRNEQGRRERERLPLAVRVTSFASPIVLYTETMQDHESKSKQDADGNYYSNILQYLPVFCLPGKLSCISNFMTFFLLRNISIVPSTEVAHTMENQNTRQ